MLLGFKTELKLNSYQRTQLAKHCGVARHAWNWGLALTKNILDHNKANPLDSVSLWTECCRQFWTKQELSTKVNKFYCWVTLGKSYITVVS